MFWFDTQIRDRLIDIQSMLRALLVASEQERKRDKMAQADIDALKVKVERMTTVSEGAVVTIGSLAQQIRDLADDPEELRALAEQLDQNATSLAAAIEANTPQTPNPDQPTPQSRRR